MVLRVAELSDVLGKIYGIIEKHIPDKPKKKLYQLINELIAVVAKLGYDAGYNNALSLYAPWERGDAS